MARMSAQDKRYAEILANTPASFPERKRTAKKAEPKKETAAKKAAPAKRATRKRPAKKATAAASSG